MLSAFGCPQKQPQEVLWIESIAGRESPFPPVERFLYPRERPQR